LLAIKAAVDADRRPGRFLLTGSTRLLGAPRLADSLAGRMEALTLWPFTQSEIDGLTSTPALIARFRRTCPTSVHPACPDRTS
jgi:predicted AAA+ superfamily ATPase